MGGMQQPLGPIIDGVRFRPGKAIGYWRKARGLTQIQCAARMGNYSVRAWQKWESGERTPTLPVWLKIAAVLRVEVTDLIGVEFTGIDITDTIASEAVLNIKDALIGLPTLVEVGENEAEQLAEEVAYAWMRWQTGEDNRFTQLGQRLPELITRTESALAAYTGEARQRLQATAADLFHLTWAYLRARGALSWARDAAHRARVAAHDSGDFNTAMAGEWGYAAVLSSTQDTESAYRLLNKGLRQIEPTLADGGDGRWEVAGQMNLLAAVQAVRLQRRGDAEALLGNAARIAGRIPSSNRFHTAFGAVNVDIHRAAVALEDGDYKTAVIIGEDVDVDAAPSKERQVAFLVQLAHAYLRKGDVRSAVESLAQAVDRSKPETAGLRLAHETAWGASAKRAKAFGKKLDYVMASLGLAS